MNDRRAISLVEVLIASVIIGLALVPILTLSQSETHQASFNESQLMARFRARRIVESLTTLDYDGLLQIAGLTDGATGEVPVPIPLPPIGVELRALAKANRRLSYLKLVERRMSRYRETVKIQPVESGLLRISAVIEWKNPGEPPRTPPHEVRYFRLVDRRRDTWSALNVPGGR